MHFLVNVIALAKSEFPFENACGARSLLGVLLCNYFKALFLLGAAIGSFLRAFPDRNENRVDATFSKLNKNWHMC